MAESTHRSSRRLPRKSSVDRCRRSRLDSISRSLTKRPIALKSRNDIRPIIIASSCRKTRCCDSVTEAVKKLDLPSVDAINSYIVSRAVARQGVKVALSGLGGDELFGGYSTFRDVPWLRCCLAAAAARATNARVGRQPWTAPRRCAGECRCCQLARVAPPACSRTDIASRGFPNGAPLVRLPRATSG